MYAQRWRWCTVIPVLSALVLLAHGATIKFDQSQTGDYNLQIHLKNIELYAVFDDSGGSDDEYGDLPDYTDPTEASSKPPQAAVGTSTTKTPSSSSSSSASVVGSSTVAPQSSPSSSTSPVLLDLYSSSNSDKIVQMVEALIASNGNTSDLPTEPPAPVAITPSPSPPPPQPSTSSSSSLQSSSSLPSAVAATSSTATATSSTANRKCGFGYFRDPMGRCRRIRKPHLPFLQMVHTPGVIKSFQPQERTSADDEAVNARKN